MNRLLSLFLFYHISDASIVNHPGRIAEQFFRNRLLSLFLFYHRFSFF